MINDQVRARGDGRTKRAAVAPGAGTATVEDPSSNTKLGTAPVVTWEYWKPRLGVKDRPVSSPRGDGRRSGASPAVGWLSLAKK